LPVLRCPQIAGFQLSTEVREGIVITCRHVLDELERLSTTVPATRRFLSFVVPRKSGRPGITVRLIRRLGFVRDRKVDVGFVEFEVVHPQHFQDIVPLEIDGSFNLQISEPVGVFGYPHGSTLTEKGGQLRWGPLLQQGWVSGLSPYEGADEVEEILLDVRADEGMSGSPIFHPATGTVIGMLQSGTTVPEGSNFGTTTVFGQPITQAILARWLVDFDLDVGNATS
jgi:hypothetical protein